jgi:hypothetical protein
MPDLGASPVRTCCKKERVAIGTRVGVIIILRSRNYEFRNRLVNVLAI